MTENHKNYTHGLLWAVTAVFIWSCSFVLLRFGITTNLNAYDLTALRFGTAAVCLCPIIIKKGFSFSRLGITGVTLLVCGFGAPYVILISLALKTAPASAAGALNPGIMAASSVLIGATVFKDRIGPIRLTGMVLIGAGLLFSIFHQPNSFTEGHAILILTGIMWAIYAITLRKTPIPALHATSIVVVGSALIYLPIYIFALPQQISTTPISDILLQMGFQGMLVSIIAVFAFNRSVELLGPIIGASLPGLIPLLTLILSFVILQETAGFDEITTAIVTGLGVTLILAGGSRKDLSPQKNQTIHKAH
ncbi:MAG: DMT family transporter [Methylocystaceae bacterium]|nr:DMT family transporter [Methylocystaceae bacterium]